MTANRTLLRSVGAIPWGVILGTFAGLALALLSENFRSVLDQDPSILTAVAGSAVGLLAVVVAVATLLITLRSGSYKKIIDEAGGVREFLEPFTQVAVVSGLTVIVSMIALLLSPTQSDPGGTGPLNLRVVFFGISTLLFVWAVIGTVRLVFVVQSHAENQANMESIDDSLALASMQSRRLRGDQPLSLLNSLRDLGVDDPDVDLVAARMSGAGADVVVALTRGARREITLEEVLARYNIRIGPS